MIIALDGRATLPCVGKPFETMVYMEVVPEDETTAKVVNLETVREQALKVLVELSTLRTFPGLQNHLAEGGHVILNGRPRYFLDKSSVRLTKL